MQLLPKLNYTSRIVYYISNLINSQIKKGGDYTNIPKTISISILNFKLIHDSIKYKHVFHLHDRKENVELTDLIEVITLELPKVPEIDNGDSIIPWLHFINADDKENLMEVIEKYPHLKEAYTKLQELSLDENAITEYNLRLRAFYDETTMLNEMERRKVALEEMQTKINTYQIEFENAAKELETTTQELETTTQELDKTRQELELTQRTAHLDKIQKAKNMKDSGIELSVITHCTGLAEADIQSL